MVAVVGIGLMITVSASEIINKRRLLQGVQIMATVTERESHFSVMHGGLSSYIINYEFQYTDRQTGQLRKQERSDYAVYQKEYATYTPGSTFVASFTPSEPDINEPVAAVGRLSPQIVLLTRLVAGLIFLGVVGVLVMKFYRLLERFEGSKKKSVIGVILLAALATGLLIGANLAHLLEQLLLR